jgi:excisionase family DNA binding protein
MKIAEKIEKLDHLLTIDELAALTSFSPKTLYSKVKAGTIPTTRISGSLRFDPGLIATWLRAKTA